MKLFVSLLLLLALLIPAQSDARMRGSASQVAPNLGRVSINVGTTGPSYANLVKGMGFAVLPTNCAAPPCADANGNPNQRPTPNGIDANPSMPAGYYSTFTLSWTGTGGFQDVSGPPTIFSSISPQGALFECGNVASCDIAPGNHTVICAAGSPCGGGSANVTNPTIVFQYGWNIQSIDNNGGVIRVNTKTNYVNSRCWGTSGTADNGQIGTLVNITGVAANTGANATWAMTNCTASSFDLAGSTFTNAQAGVQGAAIVAQNNLSYNLRNSGTWTNFDNFIIAKTANLATIAAGHYWDPVYVNQLKDLMNPNGTCAANSSCGWLRFMDYSAVQSNWETDFSQRIPATALSYQPNTWYPLGYWSSSGSGAITNTGTGGSFTDVYTTGDPSVSVWNGSRYIDGALVMGVPSATNTGRNPALNVGSHGAKRIVEYNSLITQRVFLTGTAASAGLTMQFTFQATWLNGNTPVVVSYVTVAGDVGSNCSLSDHINTAFLANGTLTGAGIQFSNSNCVLGNQINQPTPQAGTLSVTYTSGPAIVDIGPVQTSAIGTSGPRTFQYNYLLDAWIYQTGNAQGTGISYAAPLEAAIDLANQVGANVWWTYGFTSSGLITSSTQLFASNLSAGLKFGLEAFNETWNPFAHPYAQVEGIAASFGLSNSGFLANASYTGLKTKQYADVAKTAWTGASRSASDFHVFAEWQTGQSTGGVFDVSFLKGSSIGTANTYIANYGAMGGGTVATNYAAFPNRPIDVTTFIGQAPYWSSAWFAKAVVPYAGQNGITGTVGQNAAWLQPTLDWSNGSTAAAYIAFANTFNGTTSRGTCGSGALVLNVNPGSSCGQYHNYFVSQEAIAAQYDSSGTTRPVSMPKLGVALYEGANEWALQANGNATSSSNDPISIASLMVRFGPTTGVAGVYGTTITGLNWNVGPYIKSGQPAVSSGTYNSGTGLVTLTLASPLTYAAASSFTGTITAVTGGYALNVVSGLTGSISPGQAVNYSGIPAGYYVMAQRSGTPGGIGSYTLNNTGVNPITGSIAITTSDSITTALTGTGSVASLNGTFATTPTTSGSTISYFAGSGLTLTITGGTVYDTTASSYEAAVQTVASTQAWKYDDTYKNLIKTYYYQDLATVSAGRETHAAQFGYDGVTSIWSLFPGDYSAGNQYKNYDAIKEWNAGN